jgi:N-acetylglucosamine kinase-like BadF-type ATPase
MILIADSGSTKCDWLLIDRQGNKKGEFHTMGLNPYFHNEAIIENAVRTCEGLIDIADTIHHVFFYGAGASSENLCAIVKRGLEVVFAESHILVDHDLVAAAYSTYEGEPAISCIIGTGSNSCYFDGETVVEEVPALAYILGDEASGSWFGKMLLRDYFYKKLPEEIRIDFDATFQSSKEEIMRKIYNEPNANVYLAGFTRFIGKHAAHPHVQAWVQDGLLTFLKIHVECFPNYREVKTHFVGSIGFYFSDMLKKVCEQEGVQLGMIIRKPIERLADYHINYLLPQLQKS